MEDNIFAAASGKKNEKDEKTQLSPVLNQFDDHSLSDFFNDARQNALRKAPVSALGANEFDARRSFTPSRRFTDVLLIGEVVEP